ncbi:hypothetical protein GCM10007301_44830 [Azorhizobium oxalatiphilum]|uniref:LysR substrate-binding domain-containing protein n=1 Tax=Azorhizobium oxalatiphilum TaxID=980631 RepID=A0A917CCZ3_9HYPH|nr:hypothetical protein GCM10007301_44830 [Azorhizobium oxalatiphilum]
MDLGISFPDAFATPTASRLLLREPLHAVLPHTHPLARARRVKVRDFETERFLIVPRDQAPLLHDAVVRRCAGAGFAPRIALEVYLQQTIVNLVAEDLGVAFVPASMQRAQVKGAAFRRMDDPPEVDQVALWQPDNANPCLSGFLSICDSLDPPMGVAAQPL